MTAPLTFEQRMAILSKLFKFILYKEIDDCNSDHVIRFCKLIDLMHLKRELITMLVKYNLLFLVWFASFSFECFEHLIY